jgi:hypothetical protein
MFYIRYAYKHQNLLTPIKHMPELSNHLRNLLRRSNLDTSEAQNALFAAEFEVLLACMG